MKSEQRENSKSFKVVVIILIILSFLGITWAVCVGLAIPFVVGNVDTTPITVLEGTSENIETEDIGVTYPGYSTTYTINENKKTLPLINYSDNKVCIKYEVRHDNKLILVTDELAPGEGLDLDLYKYFEKAGEYDLDIKACAIVPGVGDGTVTNFVLHVIVERS